MPSRESVESPYSRFLATGCRSLPAQPAEEWTIDFLDPPTSANGFSCLLVCTELLSKFVVLVPMSNSVAAISAVAVARSVVDNVMCWFVVPRSFF